MHLFCKQALLLHLCGQVKSTTKFEKIFKTYCEKKALNKDSVRCAWLGAKMGSAQLIWAHLLDSITLALALSLEGPRTGLVQSTSLRFPGIRCAICTFVALQVQFRWRAHQ